MVDLFLKLIDKIVEFLRERKRTSSELLTEVIDPSFTQLADVVDDYTTLFNRLTNLIDQPGNGLKLAIDELASRRRELLSTRIRVREMAAVLAGSTTNQAVSDYADAIVAFFHSSQLSPNRAGTTPSTTLLVELEDLLHHPNLASSVAHSHVEAVLKNIESRWTAVARAYSRVKVSLITS